MKLLRPLWIIGLAFLVLGCDSVADRFHHRLAVVQEIGFQKVYATELLTKGSLFVGRSARSRISSSG